MREPTQAEHLLPPGPEMEVKPVTSALHGSTSLKSRREKEEEGRAEKKNEGESGARKDKEDLRAERARAPTQGELRYPVGAKTDVRDRRTRHEHAPMSNNVEAAPLSKVESRACKVACARGPAQVEQVLPPGPDDGSKAQSRAWPSARHMQG